jgi:hypothetical protein
MGRKLAQGLGAVLLAGAFFAGMIAALWLVGS